MKIDAIVASPLDSAASAARRAEALGCDGAMFPEVAHDPFLPVAIAAEATTSIRLSTGIAVAFARNPMNVAVVASDLHRLSGGRFALGLGSQIKPHITRRYSMPWSSPAARMREFVGAIRAIWDSWDTGDELRFEGDFYQHTLMTPMFSHGPSDDGWPPIQIAAVGPLMTALAGEIADGMHCHGFTTADYLRDVTIPNLEKGAAKAGRSRADVEVSLPAMTAIATEGSEPDLDVARYTVAFYGSTPAYRGVLEHHGWGDLGDELHRLSKQGEWATMASLIDDDVLKTFIIVGTSRDVGQQILGRFGGLVDRIQIGLPDQDTKLTELAAVLRAGDHAQRSTRSSSGRGERMGG